MSFSLPLTPVSSRRSSSLNMPLISLPQDGRYYPVAFLGRKPSLILLSTFPFSDENGRVCKIRSGQISVEITLYTGIVVTNTVHAPLMDSVAWFKVLKFHLPGRVSIKFSSSSFPEIPPFECIANILTPGLESPLDLSLIPPPPPLPPPSIRGSESPRRGQINSFNHSSSFP
jgi:hypothetical protein